MEEDKDDEFIWNLQTCKALPDEAVAALGRVLPAGGHPSHRTAALWRLEGLQARVATRNAFSTDLTFVFNLSICKLQSQLLLEQT